MTHASAKATHTPFSWLGTSGDHFLSGDFTSRLPASHAAFSWLGCSCGGLKRSALANRFGHHLRANALGEKQTERHNALRRALRAFSSAIALHGCNAKITLTHRR